MNKIFSNGKNPDISLVFIWQIDLFIYLFYIAVAIFPTFLELENVTRKVA